MPHKDPEKRKKCNEAWKAKHPGYHDQYRVQHTDQYAEYTRTYRQRQQEQMVLWYKEYRTSMHCSNCPESREPCLDFHHVDPDAKRFEIKRMIRKGSCSLETLLEEVDKCIILCANCHRIHHYEERLKSRQ